MAVVYFETATVVMRNVKSRYSGGSFADSTTKQANSFFFSFSLVKLGGYFYLLKV